MRRLPTVALAVLLAVAAAGCVARTDEPLPPASPAPVQAASLGWVERFESAGASMTFTVDRFEVLEDGWRATIGIENRTGATWTLGDPGATLDRTFGVMLYRTGELAELERRNESGSLPGVRAARSYEPALPRVLEPGDTWSGVISAGGSLAANRFVRVVFGTLVPVGDPPDGFPPRLVWITDNAYELQP